MSKHEHYTLLHLFFLLFVSSASAFFLAGNSVSLTCNSLERHYVKCQQTSFKSYGLRSESMPSFRVRGVEVEEYTDRDSEGNEYDAYKLYLDTGSERIYFYEYGRDFESAYADRERILDLLIGIGEPSLTLSRGANR